jgi:hypothetical protein
MDDIIAKIYISNISDNYIIPVYENEKEIAMEEIEKVLVLSWEY